jgi:formaldehyde-activating enzyme involved in methanogenesis
MATKIETDLLGVFSSFTGGTIGAAGTTITWGHIFAMESILRAKKAPAPYFLVLHPYQWHPLAKAATVAGASQTIAPSVAEQVNTSFWVKTVANVNIFVTSNISIDASDDAVCGMFSRDALALDMRRAPRIEPERDASRRGWELNLSAIYAKGVWRPTFGVKGTFDAAVPTS